ncbi:MAG: 2-phosphosulfolactate phosphatase [Clostridiaceae bacterium]|jgi:2-phosphosulfolactate phosphatase|nr:2-phosphosulfolactate phosphatase [Clostridiaceae bacterium]
MEIAILQLLEGARQARGAAVIIDVFRAYSVECYGFAQGLRRIYPVGDLEEARRLKAARPEYLLCGEREGRKQPGCDFGNSPLEIAKQDLTGRVLIHTTSAGTQGLENAKGADFLLAASLVNAKATAEYLRRRNPSQVSLVCMGLAARRPTDEDTLCAQYIRALLLGLPFDKEQAVKTMRQGDGRRFFIPEDQSFAPREDFDLCVQFDRFPYALPVRRDAEGRKYVEREIVQ